ncbi:fimbrial protein [Glaciimonas sp. PAMC28666]|uniref:fimbrial protein n=1 Tax=Glaciimonas sp. PAMC28666 TaxID=2807626 RepID=UPI001963B93D|nr:fimbrial protein [Glaciimonas sp. PAMC28666]QRX83424.1 fimbrial protein [Glaciimonas sp. PAMC28666]
MKFFFAFTLFFSCILPAFASPPPVCSFYGSNTGFQTLTVSPSAAVGDNLGPPVSQAYQYVCTSDVTAVTIRYDPALALSTAVGSVWETGVAGIGIKVINLTNSSTVISNIGGPLTANSSLPYLTGTTIPAGSTVTYSVNFSFQLVKTAAITPTSSSTVTLFQIYPVNAGNVVGTKSGVVSFTLPAVTTSSCNVTTPSITVTMPTLSTAGFSAVGNTGGSQQFNLGINCSASTHVSVTLTDATTTTNNTTTLSLTPSSTASGIGYQILDQFSNLIKFSSDTSIGNPAQQFLGLYSGSVSIPLVSQYISTGTVLPGTVNAAATFTMVYQ